jgi:hypothetical protein
VTAPNAISASSAASAAVRPRGSPSALIRA